MSMCTDGLDDLSDQVEHGDFDMVLVDITTRNALATEERLIASHVPVLRIGDGRPLSTLRTEARDLAHELRGQRDN